MSNNFHDIKDYYTFVYKIYVPKYRSVVWYLRTTEFFKIRFKFYIQIETMGQQNGFRVSDGILLK